MFELEEAVERRVARTHGTLSFTVDRYHECEAAQTLGLQMRLVSGYKHMGPMPPSIVREIRNGVPSFLLGVSILQCPKVVRYLFLIDLPSPVYEADLVASHMCGMLGFAKQYGIEYTSPQDYARSVDTIKAFRAGEAARAGIQPADVKEVLNMIGYGNSGDE
jgi:hypothetical protein